MKLKTYTLSLLTLLLFSSYSVADAPRFFKDTMPEAAMPGMLAGWGTLKGKDAALDAKTTELIALAVAAQIPCEYCVYAHSTAASKLGATDAELRHAIAVAGYVRLFSTGLHGMQYDLDAFKAEVDVMK